MTRVVALHSFRRGTGKSVLTANLAVICAAQRLRTCVVDADFLSPVQHILFGLDDERTGVTLDDYLLGHSEIDGAIYDVSSARADAGALALVPASTRAGQIVQVLRGRADLAGLQAGLERLGRERELDVILIDVAAGLVETSLLFLAAADALAVLVRPDQQDYQGTAVTLEVARRLGLPDIRLIVNNVPSVYDLADVEARFAATYACPVIAALPHADEMLAVGTGGFFVLQYPGHPITARLVAVAEELAGAGEGR